jgi:transcriptional regulator with XRE-family HTH domain
VRTVEFERIIRVGDKLISLDKAERLLERVIKMRSQGVSQQEVARRLSLDRSFISRLESAGEIRKGKRIAVLGFPLQNKETLAEICREMGLEYVLLMDNRERWVLVKEKQALDFFNQVFEMAARLREFDSLVLVTSEKWYRLAEALLDIQIIFISLGQTPVHEDKFVEPEKFRAILAQIISSSEKS